MSINVQETYRTPKKGTKKLPFQYNNQNITHLEQRILKTITEELQVTYKD